MHPAEKRNFGLIIAGLFEKIYSKYGYHNRQDLDAQNQLPFREPRR
jgi:hypothetical protein